MKRIGKYSLGIGDRFGKQGDAQLKAIIEAGNRGLDITPVWNKSNREHLIIGTHPDDVRAEADTATARAGFSKPYFVDADHINIDNVGPFVNSSDFFTIDVASYIGKTALQDEIDDFMSFVSGFIGKLEIPGMVRELRFTTERLSIIVGKYLHASKKAGETYREIVRLKGSTDFVTEVSMDEVAQPQTPLELFFILAMLAREEIPVQTIAPKFSGRFNKGVDYVGNPSCFASDFEDDLLVIDYACRVFGLPENLKLSVHSGSDKFSIYGHMGLIMQKHDKGIHLKTAGTTWLEEVIGLAEAGGEALDFVKDLYVDAIVNMDELCSLYADVIDIDKEHLPPWDIVSDWTGRKFAASLRHIPGNNDYNPHMRQLMHVAYKLAAAKKDTWYRLTRENEDIIASGVYENIFKRHICRLFNIDSI